MKKVLSLVLALTMVFGMSTIAFAGTGDLDVVDGSVYSDPNAYTADTGDTITMTDFIDVSATGTAGTAGNLTLQMSGTDAGLYSIIGSVSSSFAITTSSGSLVGADTTTVKARITIKSGAVAGTYGGAIMLVDGNSNTFEWNINSITVNAASSTTDVPSGAKITGIADDWVNYLDWTLGDFNPNSTNNVTGDMVAKSYLTPQMFTWVNKDGAVITPTTGLRSNHLTQSSNKIDVRKTNPTNNSGTIKEVVIDGITLKVKTVKYFLKCGETDVSFDLALTHKSSASSTKYGASFTISNSKEYIDEGQTEVDTDDHIYLEADASVRNLEMYIGENLYLTKSFGKGQKAYARVDLELSAGGEALFQKFPELSDVYTLYTVGVSSAGVTAWFDIPDTLFVYDENYKLVGTTADTKLPFSNTYYLTTKKVDLGGSAVEGPAETDESSTTPAETDNAGTGGGTVTAPSNYNPNTGR